MSGLREKSTATLLLAIFVMSVFAVATPAIANGDDITVVSDGTIEWSSDGSTWQTALVCWKPPSWPTIEGATWIWRTEFTDPSYEYENMPDGGWYFRKIFTIPHSYDLTGSISITADNAYELKINGVHIGGDGAMSKDGPDNLEWNTTEVYDISSALKEGENTILIRVVNYLESGTAESNPAGLIFKATITYKPLPDFVIPEFPLGTLMGLASMLSVLLLARKYTGNHLSS